MRDEFTKKVKRAAFERAEGKCEICGARLHVGKFAYDHVIPDAMGGSATLENCQVGCTACHGTKTAEQDVPTIAKSNRVRDRHAGIRPTPRNPMPGSKASKWKRRMDGTVIKRGEP